VERIVAQGRELNKDRVFIPTGFQSKELIVQSHLNLGDVDQFSAIDVTIDGADEYVFSASSELFTNCDHFQSRPRPQLYQRWRSMPLA